MALLLDQELLLRNFALDPRVLSSIVNVRGIVLGYQICSVARAQLHLSKTFLLLFLIALLLVLSDVVVFHLVGLDELLRGLALVQVVGPEVPQAA